jgi:hypothetical protein
LIASTTLEGKNKSRTLTLKNKGCVSHNRGLAIYIKKYLKAKEENYGNSIIFHHSKNIIFKKNLYEETKILQNTYYNSRITKPKFEN